MTRESFRSWMVVVVVGVVQPPVAAAAALPAPPLEVVADDHIFASRFESFALTIDNYLAWCNVTVGNDAPTSADISKAFPDGTVVPLHAEPADPFVWGFWTGTDTGGIDANQDAEVTMSTDRNVFVCCPLSGGTCNM